MPLYVPVAAPYICTRMAQGQLLQQRAVKVVAGQ